jgi:8-oxo-dGTP pyrophosphatase MutT (NUDIX family)
MAAPSWSQIREALSARPPTPVEAASKAAAVALILREGLSGIEALFIRRAEHPDDPWSGHVGFPGGRREPGDMDLRATAVRETAEETGIDLAADAEYLGALDELRAMARLRPLDLTISPFVYRLAGSSRFQPNQEVRDLLWLPLSDLLDPARRSVFDYVDSATTLRFPCVRIDDLVLWGLTYRMFTGFEERIVALQQPAGGSEEVH